MTEHLEKKADVDLSALANEYLNPLAIEKNKVLTSIAKKGIGWGVLSGLARAVAEMSKAVRPTEGKDDISSYIEAKYPSGDIDPLTSDTEKERRRALLGLDKASAENIPFSNLGMAKIIGSLTAAGLGSHYGAEAINKWMDRVRAARVKEQSDNLLNQYEALLFKEYADTRGLDYSDTEKDASEKEAFDINALWDTIKGSGLTGLGIAGTGLGALGFLAGKEFPSDESVARKVQLERFRDYLRNYLLKAQDGQLNSLPFRSSLIEALEANKYNTSPVRRKSLQTVRMPDGSVEKTGPDKEKEKIQDIQAILEL